MRQHQQRKGDVDRAADAGGDLGERHQRHAVARRQDRHVAGAALPALAAGNDGDIDRVHADFLTD